MPPRIMYIEFKGGGLSGPARIGRVTFSQTGKTIYYRGKEFSSLGGGYKANYFDVATREQYWISGCKKNGSDHLYCGITEIDEDVREEYWTAIRGLPQRKGESRIQSQGKY